MNRSCSLRWMSPITLFALQTGQWRIHTFCCFYFNTFKCVLWTFRSHTDSFNDKSLRWPQSPAHPRFPQHLQVAGVALNEKHEVFHPSLKVHLSYSLDQSLIPETSRVLRFKVFENLLTARTGAAEFPSAGAHTLLVRAENYSQRSCWELNKSLLVRHFKAFLWAPETLETKTHALKGSSLIQKSK